MFREFVLISALILSTFGQLHNDQPFEQTQIFDLSDVSAESLSANEFGNRLLVGGGKSGILTLLDIENLNIIHILDTLDFNIELESIAKLAVNENRVTSDSLKRLKDISANVTDVKYLTGGRYCVATIAFYSKELDRHPLLNIGALAFIDMESFAVKTFHITDPNPESVAISYDNNYYLVACQGFRDDFQESLSISGSVMRYELSGANIEFSGRFTFDDDAECDFKLLSGCILRDPHTRLDHITTSPVENIAAVTDQSCNALLMLDIETLRIYRIIDMGFSQHLSDTNDNNTIDFKFTNTLRLEPDGVVFSQNGQYVLTANEGKLDHTDTDDHDLYEFYSGGRNITVLDLSGKKIYDSRHLTEVNEAITGQYNDKHSDTHGSQLESLTIGNVDGNSFLAVTAEKSSVVHFFDIKDMKNIRYLGHVPTGGKAPEGIIYVPVQEVFICANEKSNSISVFEFRQTINRDYNE